MAAALLQEALLALQQEDAAHHLQVTICVVQYTTPANFANINCVIFACRLLGSIKQEMWLYPCQKLCKDPSRKPTQK
jgi:hypothetical protein